MQFPYEVRFKNSEGWGCWPCKTLRDAKTVAAKNNEGRSGQIWKRLTQFFPNTERKIMEFDASGRMMKND